MIKDINIRSIVNIVAAIRLGTFCLILLRVLNELGSKVGIDKIMIAPNMPLYTIVVVTLLMIAIYFVWMFFYYYRNPDKHKRKSQIIEDILFMVFATLLIVVTDTYESNYKFLYLFGIISATINAGKRYGISLSLITSGIISTIDLVCGKDLAVNTYFQNDLILCAGYIVIAWVFGEYVKTEKQRRILEREIKHQLKRHDFIEEMLLNNEHSYDIIIDKSKEIIVIHDQEKILYANKYAMDFLGINDVNDCMQPKHQIVHEDYKEIFKKNHASILKGERKVITTEGKIYDKNGEIIDIEDTSAFCVYRKKNAVLSIIRDITPKKQVIQLKEDMKKNEEMLIESRKYNQYVTELFANISHELKTPLNIIFSSTQLLSLYNGRADQEVVNKRKEYLQSIKYNSYRLTRLIDNILDASKLEAGFINLNLRNANIVEEVENITMSIIPYAESKGIEITFDTDEEDIIMAFDADKIERIMLNLLSNALKFTNEGGHIYVNIYNEEGFVNISVKDTGIGIPEDMKALIFERFMQVDKTFRRRNEGTGIGLALVKSFTELHKGRVTLESELQKGSEFTITLPITLVDVNDDKSEIKGSILDKVDLELSDIYTRRN